MEKVWRQLGVWLGVGNYLGDIERSFSTNCERVKSIFEHFLSKYHGISKKYREFYESLLVEEKMYFLVNLLLRLMKSN